MHKLYLEKMDFNTNKEKIIDIIDMLMCEIKETKHKLYEHIECEMYEMVYGKKNGTIWNNSYWYIKVMFHVKHWHLKKSIDELVDKGINSL